MAKKPITTIVSISRLGIWDSKRKCWYKAPWMREYNGAKVYVLSDMFEDNAVHVFDAEHDKHLGVAKAFGIERGQQVELQGTTAQFIRTRRNIPTLLSYVS